MLKVAWLPVYAHPLPAGHRFPMEKYSLLPEQLLYEGTLTPENFFAPGPVAEANVLATHDAHYWHRLRNRLLTAAEIRRIGRQIFQIEFHIRRNEQIEPPVFVVIAEGRARKPVFNR